ncbi:MAG: Ig-like domain-containing protein [Lachnospiraceae bacterium]|nr:Ig-like domain-containing protein [Lachnospiraceae bacterium]
MEKKRITRHIFKIFLTLLLVCSISSSIYKPASARIAPVILLSDYIKEMNVGDEYYLFAYSSDGRIPKFSSSDRKIATVDTYGRITAKKAGNCTITVKAFTSEASCRIRVVKTQIKLNKKTVSIENQETFKLDTEISNKSVPVFKSNKKSVAIVDDEGNITGCKPGNAIITVQAGGSSANCHVTVRKPVIKLDRLYKRLYRCQSFKLCASVSSGITPVWKSNKKSIATVDENGKVTAIKHGTALITAKADGVSKTCEVVVEPPEIKLESSDITLKEGSSYNIGMTISSGNAPVWTSSKESVASVDQLGNVYALEKGTSTITVSEDGAKARCRVNVISG